MLGCDLYHECLNTFSILFSDPEGNLLDQYKNENGHPDYKYYHFSANTSKYSFNLIPSHITALNVTHCTDDVIFHLLNKFCILL